MDKSKRMVVYFLFGISIFANLIFVALWKFEKWSGPPSRVGILAKDILLERQDGASPQFKLPKGLVVRDATPHFSDKFWKNSFSITVGTNADDIVDYSNSEKLNISGHFYSVRSAERDVRK